MVEYNKTDALFPAIDIMRKALMKANVYAEIVKQLSRKYDIGSAEVYGYLLNERTPRDRLIRDAVIASDQFVSPVSCEVEPEGIEKSLTEIFDREMRPSGWWHSHKGLSLDHHSSIDDRNFKSNALGFSYGNPTEYILDDQPVKLSSASSIIVMDKGIKPYGEIAYARDLADDPLRILSTLDRFPGRKPISIRTYGNDSLTLDELDAMMKEAARKVSIGYRTSQRHPLDPSLSSKELLEIQELAEYCTDKYTERGDMSLFVPRTGIIVPDVPTGKRKLDALLESYTPPVRRSKLDMALEAGTRTDTVPPYTSPEQTIEQVTLPSVVTREESPLEHVVETATAPPAPRAPTYEPPKDEPVYHKKSLWQTIVDYFTGTKETATKKLYNAERIASKVAKKLPSYLPVVGALTRKDKLVDKVMQDVDKYVTKNGNLDMKEFDEMMYHAGVNNYATRKAIRSQIKDKYQIEAREESKYKSDIAWVNWANKYLGLGKFGKGLEIYKDNKYGNWKDYFTWDAIKRNSKVGGEVSAMVQGAGIAVGGLSAYHALGVAQHGLEDILKDKVEVGKYAGLGMGVLGLSNAINSGSLTGIARSLNSTLAASKDYIAKGANKLDAYLNQGVKHGKIASFINKVAHSDKFAHISQLASQAFMLGGLEASAQHLHNIYTPPEVHVPHIEVPHHEWPTHPLPMRQDTTAHVDTTTHPSIDTTVTHPDSAFTPEQLDTLARQGWVDRNHDGNFEYTLGAADKGLGISQILMRSDEHIGNDTVMSPLQSGHLAHEVALMPGSGVTHVGSGSIADLRDPHKYVVHTGDTIQAPASVMKQFFG